MFFTICLGYRDKVVEGFGAVCSGATHVRAIGVIMSGKNPWPQPERGPFCVVNQSEGQTLALHSQLVFSQFQAFPGHFCRTRDKERQQVAAQSTHTHTVTHMPPHLQEGSRADANRDCRSRTEQHSLGGIDERCNSSK